MSILRGLDEWIQADIWKIYFSVHVLKQLYEKYEKLRRIQQADEITPEDMESGLKRFDLYDYEYIHMEKQFYLREIMFLKRGAQKEFFAKYLANLYEIKKKTDCLWRGINRLKSDESTRHPLKYARNIETGYWFIVRDTPPV